MLLSIADLVTQKESSTFVMIQNSQNADEHKKRKQNASAD
jgi:hypothetical protein